MKLPSNIRFVDKKLKADLYKLETGNDSEKKLINDEIIIVSLIIEWLDHKEYDKRFKY
ncbi:MAG: hypothetical protein KKF46_01630 [Nanoarchaeota archaeon]|nr:hypothetical protein [Nanoarchaeota archaeon]MBU1321032.1 hypothetical protein [Nanoarchaeota archaeon]MBU1598446.1 hypothetical protein [Nanoarchaeota archaeon]MBU2441372.1 hypothetical protein [Nanoarchaeota archaeon]